MCNDLIASLEILYRDAKASVESVDTKSQRQQLALSYLRSLVRRMDARLMMSEEARDEIAIALVGRARPVFAFIGNEDITGSKVVPVVVASVKLSGEHRNVHALRGEISFGTRSACHVVRVPGRSESISMVG